MRVFGEPDEEIDYIERPGAYAVCREGGEVMVVREASGIFLPGGGIESGESAREALRRELLEETGYETTTVDALGRADQYTDRNAAGRAYLKQCRFFEVELDLAVGRAREPELEHSWVAVEHAREMLDEQAFRWALEQSQSSSSRSSVPE